MAEAPLSVTAGSVVFSANGLSHMIQGTAGATITVGQYVYLDSTTNTYKLADSNASAATAAVIGVAATGGASGQPILVCTEDNDFTPGATLSISVAASSGVYCLAAAAGSVKPLTALTDMASGEYPVIVFVAKSATKAILKPVTGTAALTA